MNIIIPPALHSRRVSLELTTRLCSKDHLLQGINDIMQFEHSEDCELQRCGRKIIALTEVARSTLKRLKVELYLFVACSEDLLPFKRAYFRLILFIERRKHAFGSNLNERISHLLDPLYTRFAISCGGVDPRAQLGIEGLPAPPEIPAAWKGTIQPVVPATAVSSAQQDAASNVMLPPDAFENRKKRLSRLGEFLKEQSARKLRLAHARLLRKAHAANPGEARLVPKQYPAGKPGAELKRLVPQQHPAGKPELKRLVPKQYATGNPEGQRLVPKQYATGNPPEARQVVPKQYTTGNPEEKRFVPKQYATGTPEERYLAPQQHAVGKPEERRLVHKQYPAGQPAESKRVVPQHFSEFMSSRFDTLRKPARKRVP